MPYQDLPENPAEWQDAQIPRYLNLDRTRRQFFIVDVPTIILFLYFLLLLSRGFLLIPKMGPLVGSLSAVVMLLCVFRLLHTARHFLIELFRPSDDKDLGSQIRNRLWALHDYIFGNYILINKSELDPADQWSQWLGGPASLVIYDGFAVYLDYGNRFSRVVGAGIPIPFLDTRETIKAVVDLRPQFRDFDVNAWTKDGIKVILGVRIEARIGSDYSPDSLDPKLLYPFDPQSVRLAVEYTAVRERNKELSEVDWCDGVKGNITGLLAHHISSRRLDELYLADRGEGQILSAEVLKQIKEKSNNYLKKRGIHLSNLQITKTNIPETVYGQRLDVWKAGKDSVITRIQGEAHAYEIRAIEAARAEAQRDLIVSITNGLGKIDPRQLREATLLSLSKVLDQGLHDPLVRTLMADDTIALLENLR